MIEFVVFFMIGPVLTVIGLCGWWFYWANGYNDKTAHKVLSAVIGVVLSVAIVVGGLWFLHNTASGVRIQTSWESQLNIGLDRTATVYSATGEQIYEFTGRFDVVHEGMRILFDVVHDCGSITRNIIYAPTGSVVIVEHLNSEVSDE